MLRDAKAENMYLRVQEILESNVKVMEQAKKSRVIYEGVKLPSRAKDRTKDFIMKIEDDSDQETAEEKPPDPTPSPTKQEQHSPSPARLPNDCFRRIYGANFVKIM